MIVVGGGIPGCTAAYSACTEGKKVALIHEMEYLGGNASKEVGLTPEGRIGGIVDLLSERMEDGDIATNHLLNELENCDVYLSEHVFNTHVENNKIISIESRNIKTNEESVFTGKVFIDCSGRAILGMLSGASTMIGQESQSDFNESLAPLHADNMHHGNNVLFRTEMKDEPVDFPEVKWAQEIAKDYSDLGGQISKVSCVYGKGPYVGPKKIEPRRLNDGSWENAMNLTKSHFWEYGQYLDPYKSGEEIRDYLMAVIIGTYANVREKDSKYQNLALVHLTNVAATGGFRNYVGDYILNENDIRNHTDFKDAIVLNQGAFCLHYPGNKKYNFRLGNWKWIERDFKPYTVPYRSLYSKDISNLFCAGKHISVTHIAGSTTKLIGNGGHQGVAVGIAASMCVDYHSTNRDLYVHHLEELLEKVAEKDGDSKSNNA